MTFINEKLVSITETKQRQRDFVKQINDYDEILVLSNNKPCYVALSWNYYVKLNKELEYYRDKELIESRLNEEIDINSLKTHEELKKEGLFE